MPYFKMHNKEADLSGLRAIGVRAFVHRETYTRKLDDRAFEEAVRIQSGQQGLQDLQPSQGHGRGKPQRDLFGDAGIWPAPGRHVRRLPLREGDVLRFTSALDGPLMAEDTFDGEDFCSAMEQETRMQRL